LDSFGIECAFNCLFDKDVSIGIFEYDLLDNGVVISLKGEFDVCKRRNDLLPVLLKQLNPSKDT
jgi:hypothetical protein